jgi:hypothetical protein
MGECEMRCPFIDPEYELDIDEPCPVCGQRGDRDFTKEEYDICMNALQDGSDDKATPPKA